MGTRRFGYAHGISSGENKFVYAAELTACGNSGAQALIFAAVDFQEFAGAGVNLLADGSSKPHDTSGIILAAREVNRFRAQRKRCRAASFECVPLQEAAARHAIINFAAEQIRLSDELRSVGR